MKLSARTIQILKSFAQINPSLIFTPGNEIKTISPMKTMVAKATIAETIPQQFAIWDLSKFLGVLSLFDDPEVVINEKARFRNCCRKGFERRDLLRNPLNEMPFRTRPGGQDIGSSRVVPWTWARSGGEYCV